MPRTTDQRREKFAHFERLSTRWEDNDVYGHVNNVVYYSYFDTLVNRYLIAAGGLDLTGGTVIGIVAESHCQFFHELAFPEEIDGGLRVGSLGNSSVRYEIGLFRQGSDEPAAVGYFVHVFVDRQSRRPTPIPAALRGSLARLQLSGPADERA